MNGYAWFWFVMFILAAMAGCSPRSFQEINKQAPLPPYAGQYHGGLDRAQYLRDTEPLE